MGKLLDYRFYIDSIPGWIEDIQNLLECHKVYLYHRPDEFYLVKMFSDVDGDVLCIPFRTEQEGKTLCAWPDCVAFQARQYCEYICGPWRECKLTEVLRASKAIL